MSKSPGILPIASEAFPLVKVDGLADVIGALPKALAELGHQVGIAIPFYACIRCDEAGHIERCRGTTRRLTGSLLADLEVAVEEPDWLLDWTTVQALMLGHPVRQSVNRRR